MKKMKLMCTIPFMLLVSSADFADEINAAQNAVAIDTVWTLYAAALVFFMQAGLDVTFGIIRATVGLRVSPEEELRGLDIGEHGIEAYSGFQIFTTQ